MSNFFDGAEHRKPDYGIAAQNAKRSRTRGMSLAEISQNPRGRSEKIMRGIPRTPTVDVQYGAVHSFHRSARKRGSELGTNETGMSTRL